MSNTQDVTTADREVTLTRTFDHPRSLVWRAYTDKDLLARWWGRGNPLEVKEYEPVRGGFWHLIERADGQEHVFRGRFREVSPEDLIIYSFEYDGMPGHVTIDHLHFEDLGGTRTRLTSITQFHTNEERDGMLASGMTDGAELSFRALEQIGRAHV